ncbi:hypothetical protein [Corynebacterium yonathiae]|uniref:DUF3137 domain-containing protein n=1 Tax=Corynebacterium yonathiae TaxID=2913504 RepID=A0ABU8Y6R0_9CORY
MNLRLCNYVPSSPYEDEFFSKENIKRVSTPNTRPDATGLRETVINNGPCPTKNHTKFDFIFQLVRMGYIVILGLFPFALTGLDFRIALLISLPIIAFGISKPVRWLASTHNERTLLRKAWANSWLDFYPVLVGNFHHFDTKEEKNPIGDDRYYFHHSRIMVFFPNGSTEVLPELATVKALDYPPEAMRSDGTAIAETPDDLRVSATENNGWLLLSVLAGDPISEGTLDIGLDEHQVEAALAQVEREWVPDFLN